jgi:beta-lactamase regulating signal transducer with metallopeptidase domain
MSITSLFADLVGEIAALEPLLVSLPIHLTAWIASWLLTYAVHSTLLIGAVALATRWRSPRSYVLRDALWKTALVGGVITASWQMASGVEPLAGRVQIVRHVDGGESRAMAAARPAESLPAPSIDAGDVELTSAVEPTRTPVRVMPRTGREAAEPADEPVRLGKIPRGALPHATDVDARPAMLPPREAIGTATGTGWHAWRPVSAEPVRSTRAATAATVTDGASASEATARGTTLRDAALLTGGRMTTSARDAIAPVETWLAASWPLLVCLFWIAGAVVALLRLGIVWLRVDRLVARRRRLEDGPLPAMLARLCRAASWPHPVRLSVSPRLSGPVALGRGEICLPERVVTRLDADGQRGVLAHELAHVVRRDPLWLVASSTLSALFFFQPLNRLAVRHMREAAEFLCDDWAVQRTGSCITLARCLAEVASWLDVRRDPAPVAGMATGSSTLVRRIQRLLEDSRPRESARARAWQRPITIALLLGLALAAPGVSALVHSADSEKPAEAPLVAFDLTTGRSVPLAGDHPASLIVLDPVDLRMHTTAERPRADRDRARWDDDGDDVERSASRYPPIVLGPDDGQEYERQPRAWSGDDKTDDDWRRAEFDDFADDDFINDEDFADPRRVTIDEFAVGDRWDVAKWTQLWDDEEYGHQHEIILLTDQHEIDDEREDLALRRAELRDAEQRVERLSRRIRRQVDSRLTPRVIELSDRVDELVDPHLEELEERLDDLLDEYLDRIAQRLEDTIESRVEASVDEELETLFEQMAQQTDRRFGDALDDDELDAFMDYCERRIEIEIEEAVSEQLESALDEQLDFIERQLERELERHLRDLER